MYHQTVHQKCLADPIVEIGCQHGCTIYEVPQNTRLFFQQYRSIVAFPADLLEGAGIVSQVVRFFYSFTQHPHTTLCSTTTLLYASRVCTI